MQINYGEGQRGINCARCGKPEQPYVPPILTIVFEGDEVKSFRKLVGHQKFDNEYPEDFNFALKIYEELNIHNVPK